MLPRSNMHIIYLIKIDVRVLKSVLHRGCKPRRSMSPDGRGMLPRSRMHIIYLIKIDVRDLKSVLHRGYKPRRSMSQDG